MVFSRPSHLYLALFTLNSPSGFYLESFFKDSANDVTRKVRRILSDKPVSQM